jgi:hypothetical protein
MTQLEALRLTDAQGRGKAILGVIWAAPLSWASPKIPGGAGVGLGDEWSFREQARATAMIEGVRPDLTLQSKEGLSQPGVVPTGQGQCPLEPKSTAEQKWDWSQRQSPVTAAQGSVFPLHRARASPQQGGSWR